MYDRVDGALVHPSLSGQAVPAPPKWVRNLKIVPVRYQHATLAAEIKEIYSPELVQGAVDFVKSWPENRESGKNLLLIGEDNSELSRLGAAVLNEIYMRFRESSDITSGWCLVGTSIPWVMENRKADTFTHTRNLYHEASLLWVHNPLQIQDYPEGRWFLNSIYSHREASIKPTITTIRVENVEEAYKEVTAVFNKGFVADLTSHTIIAKGPRGKVKL